MWASCRTIHIDALEYYVEQMDVTRRLIDMYPDDLYYATSAQDIEDALAQGKIASLIGVEGGHAINSNLGMIRIFYELGARYMTLTHNCNTPW